jgi:hypothetical protein
MSLTVNWIDRNITVDKFRIYRANSPILDGALPAVLAEVAAGVFTYTDTTAVRNQVYHYRVSTVVGTEETLSSNMPLAYMPYTGPGPQKLLRGDWSCGTFGRMNPEDLFGVNEMLAMVNNSLFSQAPVAQLYTCWIKMVLNGKILFFPDQSISYSGAAWGWDDLYKAGLVYGADDPSTWSAAAKSTYGTIPQNYIASKGNDNFIVRLPGTRVGALTGSAVPANQVGGEFDYLIAPNFQGRVQAMAANLPALDDITLAVNEWLLTKDVTDTTGATMIIRGHSSQPDGLTTAALAYRYGYLCWRPVLELIL